MAEAHSVQAYLERKSFEELEQMLQYCIMQKAGENFENMIPEIAAVLSAMETEGKYRIAPHLRNELVKYTEIDHKE